MADLASVLEDFDRLSLAAEQSTIDRVAAALEAAYRRMEPEFRATYARTQGMSLLASQRRLLIMQQLSSYLALINPTVGDQIEREFEQLLTKSYLDGQTLASDLSQAITSVQLESFSSVPIDAIRFQAQDGRNRLSRHSEEFAARASGIIEYGLAMGWGADRCARELRRSLKITKDQADMIARTESISARNSATIDSYQRSKIGYYQRCATFDNRTCPLCQARHGSVYPLSVPVVLHPRDRCYPIPFNPDWAKAGLIDLQWWQAGANTIRAASGQSDNFGLAPFERSAGLTQPPTPVWTLSTIGTI